MATPRPIPENINDALGTISYRLEKVETDFIGHLQKVETRLDQIADLARTVAVLQQQTNQHNDQLADIRAQLREHLQKNEQLSTKIDTRLDDITSQVRDRFEIAAREEAFKIKAVSDKAVFVESEFKKWLNRGIGAWAILTLVAGSILGGFYRWIDSIESTKNTVMQQSQTVQQSHDKHSQQIEQLQHQSAAQQVANQGIQRSLTDIDTKLFQLSTQARSVTKPTK